MAIFHKMLQPLRKIHNYWEMPGAAKIEHLADHLVLPKADPGIERAIDEGIAWLSRAQDNSASRDGGVAGHYSLVTGWSTSYPETTGYIVPTMLAYAKLRQDEVVWQRVRRMLDWLVAIQLPNGAFQAGLIDSKPVVPVTFNTGQILLGLVSGVREFGEEYQDAMRRAADWLVNTQEPDGCWRKHPTPLASPGDKAYETHVAWALLEAARLEPKKPYADAALANVRWALGCQRDNGWFDNCCLDDLSKPLTHTLGYALRGLIEAYRFTGDGALLSACQKTANGLVMAMRKDGFLSGRLYPNWRGAVRWSCLTGSVQIAYCWLLLYRDTAEVRYRDAAYAANRYVRRTMKVRGPHETRGAIKGAFPVDGDYGNYQYLNWACKFFIDSNLLEKAVRQE